MLNTFISGSTCVHVEHVHLGIGLRAHDGACGLQVSVHTHLLSQRRLRYRHAAILQYRSRRPDTTMQMCHRIMIRNVMFRQGDYLICWSGPDGTQYTAQICSSTMVGHITDCLRSTPPPHLRPTCAVLCV
jgi:hypothetical protein